jgi:hypothetical protein
MKLNTLRLAGVLCTLAAAACADNGVLPTDPELTSITVAAEENRTELPVNGTLQLTAAGRDQDGGEMPTGPLAWSSADTTRARIDGQGVVTGRANGTVILTAASANGIKGTLTLTIRGAVHRGPITQSETWREADNPHYVTDDVVVAGASSPRLTIEPGVEVRFAEHAAIFIGGQQPGSLTADGTAAKKIRFVADDASPAEGHYYGVYFDRHTGAGSSIRHADFNHCGIERGQVKVGADACIAAVEPNVAPTIADVTIQNSGSSGIVMMDGGAFGPGSANVSVSGAELFPLVIGADFAGTLPDGGTFAGNGTNRVRIFSNEPVTRTQTWANLGIAYSVSGDLMIGGGSSPVLTLADSVVLRMASGATVYVGNYSGNGEPGGLVALGSRAETAAGPVVFTRITADSDAPGKGYWDGIVFASQALGGTRLRNVSVEWAGGGEGAILTRGDRGAFITDSFITGSGSCGIRVDAPEGSTPTDLSAGALNNVFANNDGAAFCIGDF